MKLSNKQTSLKFLFLFMIFYYGNLNAKALKSSNQIDHLQSLETAILAGGCFWGMENLFQKLNGVVDTEVGYTGGNIDNPNYEIVKTGLSGHAESIKIIFDPKIISYQKILKYFFSIHDPTQLNRQQNDIGSQYASIIFYLNNQQQQIAESIIKEANDKNIFDKPIATKLHQAKKFYPAEDYHQDYLKMNPNGYNCHYQRKNWIF
jgi:methionine-S-sulfoxide reductase